MGGTETQAVWGENERDKDPFPSLIPPLFWSTAPGVDDWRRVSFQLSLSTMIKIAASGTVKTELISCRSSGT